VCTPKAALLSQKEREDIVAQTALMSLHKPSTDNGYSAHVYEYCLKKSDATQSWNVHCAPGRASLEQLAQDIKTRQALNIKLTRQLLGDLLSAIKANKQNLLALQQLENWHDWFTSVLGWAVVACASSKYDCCMPRQAVVVGKAHVDWISISTGNLFAWTAYSRLCGTAGTRVCWTASTSSSHGTTAAGSLLPCPRPRWTAPTSPRRASTVRATSRLPPRPRPGSQEGPNGMPMSAH
jgi:hypothetical protein